MPPVKFGRKVSARNSAKYWQDIACENFFRNVSCKFKNVALLNELQYSSTIDNFLPRQVSDLRLNTTDIFDKIICIKGLLLTNYVLGLSQLQHTAPKNKPRIPNNGHIPGAPNTTPAAMKQNIMPKMCEIRLVPFMIIVHISSLSSHDREII